MPTLPTSQEWLQQSTLLLRARPSTARITSKYTVLSPTSSKVIKRRAKRATAAPTTSTTDSKTPAPTDAPLASFTLKTFDPVSGTCLKYKTDKAAEVGRLVACLGRLGRGMAALPESAEEAMPDTKDDADETKAGTGQPSEAKKAEAQPAGQSGGGGGGKKKKKGKK